MRITTALLWLIARVVPSAQRGRWLEEWRAELGHARRRMIFGALPDAFALRRLPAKAGSHRNSTASAFHAFPQDIRYALRGLLASRGFVTGVLLSLAIGIGANVVAFSFVNAAIFRPFPQVRDQHELARVTFSLSNQEFGPRLAPLDADFEASLLRRELTTLDRLAAYRSTTVALFAKGQASAVQAELVTSNYFDVLGVRPKLGRFFLDTEDTTASVAVISEAAWERLFARDPHVVGQAISVNGAAVQIAGVAAPDFAGIRKGSKKPDVWIPLGLAELVLRDKQRRPAGLRTASDRYFDYVGRRRANVTMEQVRAEVSVLARQADPSGRTKVVGTTSRVWMNDPVKNAPAMAGFMAIPLLVLAIACVNAANLLLARAARHSRDWTVRLTLGATRWRVVRHVLTEACLLSLSGAALGLFAAQWGMQTIEKQMGVPMPVDVRVAAFTVAIALIGALAFSLGPALAVTSQAARRMVPASATAPAPRSRARFGLVALQAALSLALLTTGIQFTKTVFAASPYASPIPDPQRLVIVPFDLDPLRLEPNAGHDFYDRALARLRAIPGVAAAGFSTSGLVTGSFAGGAGARLWLPGTPPEGSEPFFALHASPGALQAIGIPLIEGSHFSESDSEAVRHVIVNRPFAKKYLGGEALGRSFRIASTSSLDKAADVSVIGVADGIMKRAELEPPMLYYPGRLTYHPARMIYLRLDHSGAFSAAAVHAAAREVNAQVPVGDVRTLSDITAGRNMEPKLIARGAGILGVLALVLAAGGLYSVVAFVVSMRRHEVGVRLALGADPRSIVRMIVRQALTPTLIGAAVGAAGAAAAGAIIRNRMYGTATADPLAFGGAALLMIIVMLAATWIPARHAGRVDPLTVLRTE